MIGRIYKRHSGDPAFTTTISAILAPHTYISLEFVLQKHGVLKDLTYPITTITAKNTKGIVKGLGVFW